MDFTDTLLGDIYIQINEPNVIVVCLKYALNFSISKSNENIQTDPNLVCERTDFLSHKYKIMFFFYLGG